MKKIREIIAEYTEKLMPYSPSARLDVEVIICHFLGYDDRIQLMLNYDTILDDSNEKLLENMFKMRMKKMPVAYIINNKEFMGLDFYVDENVLIPRPDTEVIVDDLISRMNRFKDGNSVTILDMCVGSGAIILSSAVLSDNGDSFNLFGVDISPDAINVSRKNANRLGVKNIEFIESDLFSSDELKKLKGCVDIIVSNPPYIEESVIETLEPDVKNYEPFIALSGGESGMDFYNKIVEDSSYFLKSGGTLIFESGHDQAQKIISKMKDCGFSDIYTKKDIQGFDRLVSGTLFK